jgi:hypothetical protein
MLKDGLANPRSARHCVMDDEVCWSLPFLERVRVFGANVGGLVLEEPGNTPQQQVLGCVDPFE